MPLAKGYLKIMEQTLDQMVNLNGVNHIFPLETGIWGRAHLQTHQQAYKPIRHDHATFDLFGIQKCFGGTTPRITLDGELL